MYALESTVSVWAPDGLFSEISKCLRGKPYEVNRCNSATDAFMVPCFCLILDGRMLTKKDREIESLECYLTGFSGNMERCCRCREHAACREGSDHDTEDAGPNFRPAEILFHPEMRERDVEGLVAVVPPPDVAEPFPEPLQHWVSRTIDDYHKKAVAWRHDFNQWLAISEIREMRRPKTAAETAERKWLPRKKSYVLKFPNYS